MTRFLPALVLFLSGLAIAQVNPEQASPTVSNAGGSTLSAAESRDPLRAALEQSRATGKGLSLYVNGVAIPGVVVSVDNGFVVARSQSQGTIVIRLERIDAVAGFVGQAGLERKTP
jgi:sRNA-binding regulator protein Hfq